MSKRYKQVIKHKTLYNFLLETKTPENIKSLKYKTIEKTIETVHHYGWQNPHLYGIGIYQLNNGITIGFNYCYEMDPQKIQNIKVVIYCNLAIL
jgi:hypothetical protein